MIHIIELDGPAYPVEEHSRNENGYVCDLFQIHVDGEREEIVQVIKNPGERDEDEVSLPDFLRCHSDLAQRALEWAGENERGR